MGKLRVLSLSDLERAMTMPEAIALMRDAFVRLSTGKVRVPVRMNLPLEPDGGRSLFMPAYAPDSGHLALKVVAVHPDNPARNLPFIHAVVMVMDSRTGQPLALMDGEFVTALRTGAGSGFATQLLARPEASTAAIFGAGVQARTQLEAVCCVRPITRVLVFGRSMANAERFAAEAAERFGIEAVVASEPAQLREADVICTATTSLAPVFEPEHVSPGCHINGVGSYRPDMTEIPAPTVAMATVFVDQREACLAEAGDLMVPMKQGLFDETHVHAELGEVANGSATGRTRSAEVTFFKSVGNAVQDLVVAAQVTRQAEDLGLGAMVDL